MFSGCAKRRDNAVHMTFSCRKHGFKPTGNSAFDAYKADTLQRLEEEQEAFESFLQRLRDAKDKQEFDAFMDDRAKRARDGDTFDEDNTRDAPVPI